MMEKRGGGDGKKARCINLIREGMEMVVLGWQFCLILFVIIKKKSIVFCFIELIKFLFSCIF